MIEEGIRYPGFAFVNVQSPCITYGQPEAQLKVHKAQMKKLESIGHDASDQLKAIDLAREVRAHAVYRCVLPGSLAAPHLRGAGVRASARAGAKGEAAHRDPSGVCSSLMIDLAWPSHHTLVAGDLFQSCAVLYDKAIFLGVNDVLLAPPAHDADARLNRRPGHVGELLA